MEVLNRSAIVLLTAAWEGYVEDLASQAVDHLVKYAPDATHLPQRLRRAIADELKNDPNHLAVWRLSGNGWRVLLQARLQSGALARLNVFNTPASSKVRALFDESCGLPDVTTSWHWRNMVVADAVSKLDRLVSLRGDIAHGSGSSTPVHKPTVQSFRKHVNQLITATDAALLAHLKAATSVDLF